jgi:arsenate reductase
MLVLGLQGSPRKKGNSDILLEAFMAAARKLGAATETIFVAERDIQPCKEYIVCEKKGFCPIKDEMATEIYARLRQAEVVVAASPVFFYGVTAQLKALIDRCQTLWARKYKLRLKDPLYEKRRGLLLGVAATRGKQIFDGMELTGKYFFDGISAEYEGFLGYRGIEGKGDMTENPTYLTDVAAAASKLVGDLKQRRRVLFLSEQDACSSQIAAAYAKMLGGDRLDVLTAGSQPGPTVDKTMAAAMAEEGIDMGFITPRSLSEALTEGPPERVVSLGAIDAETGATGAEQVHWDLPNPAGGSMTGMRQLRDEIKVRVRQFISAI